MRAYSGKLGMRGPRVRPGGLLKDSDQEGGLPWCTSASESACQCRGHGFSPWSGKIPRDTGQLKLCATATEPVLCYKRSHRYEKPTHRNSGVAPAHRN